MFDVVLVHSFPVARSSALKIYRAWLNDVSSNLFACTITLKSISEHSPFKSGLAGAMYVGGRSVRLPIGQEVHVDGKYFRITVGVSSVGMFS